MKKEISLFLFFSYVALYGQNASTLKGCVNVTNNAYIQIGLIQNGIFTTHSTTTDSDGNFSMVNVPHGRYYVTLWSESYHDIDF